MNHTILLVIVSFLFLLSCKDEGNDSLPVITVHSPAYLASYSVFDTVDVKATVTDENTLVNVRVNLTDADFITATPAQVFYPEGNSFELNTRILLDDVSLESGHYYVLIRAENGDNYRNKYQEILVQGLEQEFKQAVVITEGAGNTITIWGTQDLESVSNLAGIEGDFAASAISSSTNQLFIAGKNSLNVLAFNLESNVPDWQKQQTPGLPMHNPGCLYFDGLLYTTYNFDFIHGYTPAGQVQYDVFIDEPDAPGCIYKHGDFILTEFQKKNSVDPFIATTFALTGQEKQRRFINDDVIGFYSVDEDHVLIVFNTASQAAIYLYDVQQDVLTFQRNVPEKVRSALKVSGQTLVLACNSKVYAYSHPNGSITPILNQGASIVGWEHLQGILLLAEGNKVEGFFYPEMVNQKTLLFSDTILDLQIHYTK